MKAYKHAAYMTTIATFFAKFKYLERSIGLTKIGINKCIQIK